MAIKDDPNSVLKARDAQIILKCRNSMVLDQLKVACDRQHLKAMIAMKFDGGDRAHITVHAVDERGQDMLQTFIFNTLKVVGIPPHEGAVLVAIRSDGVIDSATWGVDTAACAALAQWRDTLMESHFTAAPFVTWFGWGNDGKPKKMAPQDFERLTPTQQDWVLRHTHPDAV